MRPVHARSATFAIAVAVALFALTFTFQVSTRAQSADARNGREIFRFDTFGDEQLWTTKLRMHEVIQGVDPTTALGVGLKVDVDALPAEIVAGLRNHSIDRWTRARSTAMGGSPPSGRGRARGRRDLPPTRRLPGQHRHVAAGPALPDR